MAGHSKWANIKHRKAGQDAKRGKVFTKLIRELTVAAREAGADADSNPRLRAAIEKGLANNMKRDTIDKAVARGSGQVDGELFDTIRYEGYGSGGIAFIIDCLTDNRIRTVSDVRHALNKNGGNLGTDGSVSYLFEQKGIFIVSNENTQDELLEIGLDHGIEDISETDEYYLEVSCSSQDYWVLKQIFEDAKIEILNSEVTLIAANQIELDLKTTQKNLQLIDVLEELDDVQYVSTNMTISKEVADQLD